MINSLTSASRGANRIIRLPFSQGHRSSRKFKEALATVSKKLWDCHAAKTKAAFSQRVRRPCEWSRTARVPSLMMDKLEKLRKDLPSLARASDFHGAFRTSNMLDRLIQRMDRHLFAAQYFHGNLGPGNLGPARGSKPGCWCTSKCRAMRTPILPNARMFTIIASLIATTGERSVSPS